jgi:hypothetical protein
MASEMLWQKTSKELVDIVTQAASLGPAAMERKDYASRVVKMLRNDFADLVDEALRAMFVPENFNHLRLHIHSSTNVLRRVVIETALAYQEPATRYLRGLSVDASRATVSGQLGEILRLTDEELAALEGATGAGEAPGRAEEGAAPDAEEPGDLGTGAEDRQAPERASEAFEEYVEQGDLDTVMSEVQRYAEVLPVVWIFPVVRKREDGTVGLDFDLYTPANATVETDGADATRATAFVTWVELPTKSGPRRFYYRWTDTTIEKLDAEKRRVVDGDPVVGDGVNHLGRLPVTACRLGKAVDSYYLDGIGGDLYDATLEACVLRTLQNARYRDSSFKQLMIDARPEDVPAEQVMGNPARPIYVSEGTVTVLDLQANLEQLSRVVSERVLEVVVAYGFSPNAWSMTTQATSGFSKKMDQAKVRARNLEQRKWLARAEADLYRLVATGVAAGVYRVPDLLGLDPEADYVVDFSEPTFEEEPLTQAKADATAIMTGQMSILDVVMRDNPDLTEHEALALLARNRLINARFAGTGDKAKGASVLEILAGTKQAELAFERVSARGAPAAAGAALTKPDAPGKGPPPGKAEPDAP